MHFQKISVEEIPIVQNLATHIWQTNYSEMISQDQIDYMLNWMYSEQKIKEDIANGDQWLMVWSNDTPMGYLHFLKEEHAVFLSKIYLEKEFHGKGLAEKMLYFVQDYAISNGLNSIRLTVNKNNRRARAFYEKMEFTIVKEVVMDIGNGYVMDDYIYTKKI